MLHSSVFLLLELIYLLFLKHPELLLRWDSNSFISRSLVWAVMIICATQLRSAFSIRSWVSVLHLFHFLFMELNVFSFCFSRGSLNLTSGGLGSILFSRKVMYASPPVFTAFKRSLTISGGVIVPTERLTRSCLSPMNGFI